MTEAPKARLASLDLLRLAAIMLVLGRHMSAPPETLPRGWRSVLLMWQRGGWVGVDLFFVLSGFLVSGLLFAEYQKRGRLSIGRFYIRRGWKIYPPFFTLIGTTLVVYGLFDRVPIPERPLVSELLFLQSYLPGLWNHTWSLAVEEHFYLLLPLMMLAIAKMNAKSPRPLEPILTVAASVGALGLLMRIINWQVRPAYAHLTHLYASHLRLDSLFFGVAISYVYRFHSNRFVTALFPWRRWLMACGILLLMPPFIVPLETTPLMFTLGLSVFYAASGMLMVGLLLTGLPRNRIVGFMAMLGAYSYSIYLWHLPVAEWGIPIVEGMLGGSLGFGARTTIYLIGSLTGGVLMAKLVELPALRLRDRWFPSATATGLETEAAPQRLALANAVSGASPTVSAPE